MMRPAQPHTLLSRGIRLLCGSIVAIVLALVVIVGEPVVTDSLRGPSFRSPSTHAAGRSYPAFVENRGQTDPKVRFALHAPGGMALFAPKSIALLLALPESAPDVHAEGLPLRSDAARIPLESRAYARLDLSFAGATANVRLEGLDRQAGVANYILGNEPAAWRFGVPTYGQVRYAGLYPGIDLRWDLTDHFLKGTFQVAPGVDPAAIRWHYSGAHTTRVDPRSGRLLVELAAAESTGQDPGTVSVVDGRAVPRVDAPAAVLTEERPVAWQEVPDGRGRVSVQVVYRVTAGGWVGFDVGSYDRRYALVIDPVLKYGSYLGATQNDTAAAVAVDVAGNAYITGRTDSGRFPQVPPSGGVLPPVIKTFRDALVAKFSPDGTRLLYSTFLGGANNDAGFAIAVDAGGYAYVTGETYSSDFPLTNDPAAGRRPVQARFEGEAEVFITKLGPTGASVRDRQTDPFLYSTFLGGLSNDHGRGIAVDAAGNAYITGFTFSQNFIKDPADPQKNPLNPPFQSFLRGASDVFVAKLNPTGDRLVFNTYLGGSAQPPLVEEGRAIAIDGAGNAYVAGVTASDDFPPSPRGEPFRPRRAGGKDAFVAKMDAIGQLVYTTYLGGQADDEASGIAVDAVGRAHVVGTTASTDFPVWGAVQPQLDGRNREPHYRDAFVAALDPAGASLVFGTYAGGASIDDGRAVAIDRDGHVFVTGHTVSTDFPNLNALQGNGGNLDAFVLALETGGGRVLFSTPFGGSGDDEGDGVAVGPTGDVYVAGQTRSPNFPIGSSAYQPTFAGNVDAFVARIGDIGRPTPTSTETATPTAIPTFTPMPPTPTTTLTPMVSTTPTATALPAATATPTPTPRPLYLPIVTRDRSCPPQEIYTDVILLLDASTSMAEPTHPGGPLKIDAALAAARTFVEGFLSLASNEPSARRLDRVGIVLFNRQAYVQQGLTGNKDWLIETLATARVVDYQSRLALGLAAAIDELTGPNRKDRHLKTIVVLTDGQVNNDTADDVRAQVRRAEGLGILRFAIGYGDMLDRDLLRDVSNPAHAGAQYYYESANNGDLESIYRRLVLKVPCPPFLYWPYRE